MSWLSLGQRLLPARKAWKNFTNKLQTKLHKLQRSKAIKKPRSRLNTTRAAVVRPSHSLRPRLQRKRQLIHRCHLLQKKPAPIYIDELFIDPVSELVEQHQQPPDPVASNKCSTEAKEIKLLGLDCPANMPGTTKERRKGTESKTSVADVPGTSKEGGKSTENKTSAADDMWESSGLASPQMHGIDERAEEFIARFRAEMKNQEMLAGEL